AGTNAWSAGEATRGVACGFEAELFRRVGIQNVGLQHAILDNDSAARRHSLAVERTAAEPPDHGAVIDDGDVGASNLFAKLAGEKRCSTINSIAIYAFEDVFQDGVSDHRIKHDGNFRGFYFARAQAAKRALGCDLADLFRRIELREVARYREPIVALHIACVILRNRYGGNRTIRATIFANESVRVRQDFPPGGCVERSTFGILDAGISVERGLLSAARIVNAFFAGQGVDVFVVEIEVAFNRAELIGLRDPSERIFRSNLREFKCGLHHAIDGVARKVTRVCAGGALPVEDSHTDGFRSGFFERLDLSEANDGGEFIALADNSLGRGCATRHCTSHDVLRQVFKVGVLFRVLRFYSCWHWLFFMTKAQTMIADTQS